MHNLLPHTNYAPAQPENIVPHTVSPEKLHHFYLILVHGSKADQNDAECSFTAARDDNEDHQ